MGTLLGVESLRPAAGLRLGVGPTIQHSTPTRLQPIWQPEGSTASTRRGYPAYPPARVGRTLSRSWLQGRRLRPMQSETITADNTCLCNTHTGKSYLRPMVNRRITPVGLFNKNTAVPVRQI